MVCVKMVNRPFAASHLQFNKVNKNSRTSLAKIFCIIRESCAVFKRQTSAATVKITVKNRKLESIAKNGTKGWYDARVHRSPK